jgi:hypothetical protein
VEYDFYNKYVCMYVSYIFIIHTVIKCTYNVILFNFYPHNYNVCMHVHTYTTCTYTLLCIWYVITCTVCMYVYVPLPILYHTECTYILYTYSTFVIIAWLHICTYSTGTYTLYFLRCIIRYCVCVCVWLLMIVCST